VRASNPAIFRASPWRRIGQPPVLVVAVPFLITALVALGTIVLTGRLSRWLPGSRRFAVLLAALGGYGAAGAGVAIFVLLVHRFATAPTTLPPLPVAAAASVGLVWLMFSGRAAQRCLTAQVTLT
jgi:hypothetical protein